MGGYNNNIPTSQYVVFIQADDNTVISLDFTALDISGYSSIDVLSCTDVNTCNRIGLYSGATIPNPVPKAFQRMKILLSIGGAGYGAGWSAQYTVTKLIYSNPVGTYIPDIASPCLSERDINSSPACNPCTFTCSFGMLKRGYTGANENLNVIINIGNNAIIHFDFTYLSIGTSDYVSLYSCTTTTSCTVLLGKFNGVYGGKYPAIGPTSSTGIMKLVWYSWGGGASGWSGKYSVSQQATQCPQGTFSNIAPASPCYPEFKMSSSCQTSACTINTCHWGTIVRKMQPLSDGTAVAYTNNENMKLYIAPPSASSVSFTITYLSTETTNDYLRISSCTTTLSCTVIAASISGTTIPANPTTKSNTGVMLIEWISSASYPLYGWTGVFTCEIVSVCSQCGIGTYADIAGSTQCSLCPAGTYTVSTAATAVSSCLGCPTGTYGGMAGSGCMTCEAGSYNSATTQSACTACPDGTYGTVQGLSTSSACTNCKAGTYNNYMNFVFPTTCIACPAGTYKPLDGGQCTQCPMGTYSTALGSNTSSLCVKCQAGKYNPTLGSNSTSACLLCPKGSYNPYTGGGAFADACLYCPTGYYGIGNAGDVNQSAACRACEVGKYGKGSMPSCTSNNVYYNSGGFFVSNCRSGTVTMYGQGFGQLWVYTIYSPGQITLSFVSFNSAQDGELSVYDGIPTGESWIDEWYAPHAVVMGNVLGDYFPDYWWQTGSAIYPAPLTSYTGVMTIVFGLPSSETGANFQMQFVTDKATETTCTLCPAGSYNNISATTTCTLCPKGSYGAITGANSSSQCILCQPGKYSNPGLSVCSQCDIGTYASGNGISTCPSCSLGSYNTGIGLTSCLICNAGSFSSAQSAATCTLCLAGTYNSLMGSSSSAQCINCTSGTFSTILGSNSSVSCSKCQPGTFNPLPGSGTSAFCANCSAGTFSTLWGSNTSASCSKCVAGTFSSTLGSPGSVTCTSCMSGTYSTVIGAISTITCSNCQAGTFSTALGSNTSSLCTLCQAGKFSTLLGSSTSTYCTPCDTGTYSTLLGSPNTSAICLKCIQGTYSSIYGASACANCIAGTFNSILGQNSATAPCLYCTPGSYTNTNASSACLSCLPGTYATGNGSTTCLRCASYSYSTGLGASRVDECVPCKTGSLNKSATNISCAQCLPCKVCPPGTTSSGVCQPGTVVNTVCTCDRENTYFNGNQCIQCKTCHPNATTIRRCVKGSTSDITICQCASLSYGDGVTTCTPCPICHSTQFLPVPCSNNLLNPNSLKPCTCVPGTFSDKTNATACTVCSSGFYQPSTGGTYCMSCPAGKSSIATNGIACQN